VCANEDRADVANRTPATIGESHFSRRQIAKVELRGQRFGDNEIDRAAVDERGDRQLLELGLRRVAKPNVGVDRTPIDLLASMLTDAPGIGHQPNGRSRSSGRRDHDASPACASSQRIESTVRSSA
jgi:hypothetical protein